MAKQENYEHKISIILLGDSSVGKTCFYNHFLYGRYIKSSYSTIGIDMEKKIFCYKKTNILIMISDTAGQERFRSLTKNYYSRADGILLFFDITNRNSFETIHNWKNDIDSNLGVDSKIVIILVGNKQDKKNNRKISYDEAMKLAQEINIPYYECSSVTGHNVNVIINELVRIYLRNQNIIEENKSIALSKKNSRRKSFCCSIL